MSSKLVRDLLSSMMEPNRCYSPHIARALGRPGHPDVPAAIYLQHLIFWSTRGRRADGFIYKSVREIEEETAIGSEAQERIRKNLIGLGIIETAIFMAPSDSGKQARTTHFRIHRDKLGDILISVYGETPTTNNSSVGESPITEGGVSGDSPETVSGESPITEGGVSGDSPETNTLAENTFSENTYQKPTGTNQETAPPPPAGPQGNGEINFRGNDGGSDPAPAPHQPNTPPDHPPPTHDGYPCPPILLKPEFLRHYLPGQRPDRADYRYPQVVSAYLWMVAAWGLPLASDLGEHDHDAHCVLEGLDADLSQIRELARRAGAIKFSQVLTDYFADDEQLHAEMRGELPLLRLRKFAEAVHDILQQMLDTPSAGDLSSVRRELGTGDGVAA